MTELIGRKHWIKSMQGRIYLRLTHATTLSNYSGAIALEMPWQISIALQHGDGIKSEDKEFSIDSELKPFRVESVGEFMQWLNCAEWMSNGMSMWMQKI